MPTAPHAADDDHGHADETLEFNFGLLKPGVQTSHVFKVGNPTVATLTLKKVVNSCTCSVASASSQTIQPGATEAFTFAYHAPVGYSDERRTVTLIFAGASPRVVELAIKANVRPAMTLTVKEISLGDLREGSGTDCECEIGNFGDQDWSAVDVVNTPRWLKVVRVSQSRRAWKEITPRQTWVIGMRVDTAGLGTGSYREQAEFRARDTRTSAAIPFSFVVPKSVIATPSLLMLGSIERGKPAEASTILSFQRGFAPLLAAEFTAKFGRLDAAEATFTRLSETRWLVKVRIDPTKHTGEFLSDALAVRLLRADLPELTIPIRGHIVPRVGE